MTLKNGFKVTVIWLSKNYATFMKDICLWYLKWNIRARQITRELSKMVQNVSIKCLWTLGSQITAMLKPFSSLTVVIVLRRFGYISFTIFMLNSSTLISHYCLTYTLELSYGLILFCSVIFTLLDAYSELLWFVATDWFRLSMKDNYPVLCWF